MVNDFSMNLRTETRIMVHRPLSFATIKTGQPVTLPYWRVLKYRGPREETSEVWLFDPKASNECFFKCVCGVFLHRVIGGVGE